MFPRRPHGGQGRGYTPTAATRGLGTRNAQMAATYGPGDSPRPHGGHTGPRGPTTPPWRPHKVQGAGHTEPRKPATHPRRPHGAQGTGEAPTTATRIPGDRPRTHNGHTGPRGPATPPTHPHGAQDTGHANTAATRGPG